MQELYRGNLGTTDKTINVEHISHSWRARKARDSEIGRYEL